MSWELVFGVLIGYVVLDCIVEIVLNKLAKGGGCLGWVAQLILNIRNWKWIGLAIVILLLVIGG